VENAEFEVANGSALIKVLDGVDEVKIETG
jgi:hypothetical protein